MKADFRSVFGTTLFDYLRRHKMAAAKVLLEEGDKNVNEAAFDVGYTNVSHFIKIYRSMYGVNLGALMRKHCKGTPLYRTG